MRMRTTCGWIAVTGLLLGCGGCGFKGPLYLPERNATVVTHPPGKNKGKTAAPAGSSAPAPQQTPPAQPPQ